MTEATPLNQFDLVFDDFPRVYGIITIPDDGKSYHIYRASCTNPEARSAEDGMTCPPRFFSKANIAKMYLKNGSAQLFRCQLKPGIKLVDLRCFKYMFLDYLEENYDAANISDQQVYKFMTVLGLLPHEVQKKTYNVLSLQYTAKNMHAYKEFDNDKPGPFKYTGSRFSFRPFDDEFVAFCKDKLKGIDGYIAPALKRPPPKSACPFHPEICLFDPSSSIIQNTCSANNISELKEITLSELIGKQNVTSSFVLNTHLTHTPSLGGSRKNKTTTPKKKTTTQTRSAKSHKSR